MTDIHVDLVYAHTGIDVFYASYTVPLGTSIIQLIIWSKIQHYYPHLQDESLSYGIFNKTVTSQYVLRHNDRVELYRPLTITPIEARRVRVAKKRS